MTTPDDPATIERHEEELRATTEERELGQIHVTTHVVEVPQSIAVPVETVTVTTERRPVDAPATDDIGPYREGDALVVPVIEERIEVRKVPWIVEEVVIRQVRTAETREVTETIRREVVDVETTGDVRDAGD